MKRFLIIFGVVWLVGLALLIVGPLVSRWGSSSNLVTAAFPPSFAANTTCYLGATSNAQCEWETTAPPWITGVLLQVSSATVDSGGTTGPPSFSFTSTDNKVLPYAPGFAITSWTTSGAIGTLVMNGGPFLDGVPVCIVGASGGAAAANGCGYTTQSGGSVWNGSHVLTQLKLNNFTGFGTCSSGCGNIELACGGSLSGHSPAQCRVEIVTQHSTPTPNSGVPSYVFSQSWANTACTNHPWAATTQYATNICIHTASGHFFHQTAVVAAGNVGYCTSGSTQPVSGTTTDGTCTWADDGTTNAFPQEVAVGTGYAGGAGLPASGVVNINGPAVCTGSVNCTQAQVATGEPIIWEWPYLYWMAIYNSCYDGDTYPCTGSHTGNPGIVAHYAAVSWVAQIDYNRVGVNVGGEVYPYAVAAIKANYGFDAGGLQFISEWAWAGNQTYLANAATWKTLAPAWAILAAVNQCNNGCSTNYQNLPNALATYAVAAGYNALGSQGLQQSDLTNTATSGYPCSQATPPSNGFRCLAQTYHTQMRWLEEQTDGDSAGPGSPTTPPGSCSTIQNLTGNISNLFAFASQHFTNAAEPYATDISVMADSNYVASTTYGSGCTPYLGATPNAYSTALTNFSNGVPSATSTLGGSAKIGGSAVQQ